MDTEQLKAHIAQELAQGEIDPGHHLTKDNIQDYFLEPYKDEYYNANNEKFTLWTVLDSDPSDKQSYKIVYDEDENIFGLAMADPEGVKLFLGYYGTFMETLNDM